MRVPEIINRCVCFLCVENPQGASVRYRYGGTAFFVQVQQTPDIRFPYLVTAKHCVDRAAQHGGLKVRLNLKDGKGAQVLDLPSSAWFYHENPASDVAIMPCVPSKEFEYAVIDTATFADSDVIAKNHIGIGDELFISGLFTQRYGSERNIPIIRTGIIASMPDEPLIDDGGNPYNAYLAEVRSIGGLSGSPVFVYLEPMRVTDHKQQPDLYYPDYFLLGLVRGHWDLGKHSSAMGFMSDKDAKINMGIAVVTPIGEVEDVLRCDELVKARRKAGGSERKKTTPAPDGTFTKSDLENALRRVRLEAGTEDVSGTTFSLESPSKPK